MIRGHRAILFENHAAGADCAQLCGCTTLTTELCSLAKVSMTFLRYEDLSVHPTGQFGILHVQRYDRETRNAQLYRILVMQNKLRVSYCNYRFIGKQGNPQAIGKYDAPSMRVFQSCSFQGIGTFRHSEFLRCCDQQDSENCGNKAAADIDLAHVRWSKRRAKEIGSSCVGASVVHTPE